jgi:hypothetical protein
LGSEGSVGQLFLSAEAAMKRSAAKGSLFVISFSRPTPFAFSIHSRALKSQSKFNLGKSIA